MLKNNLCIIQARTGSTRLPGKVLLKAKGITLLEYEIKRVGLAKKIDRIVVATTVNKSDDKIAALCQKIKIDCFRGSENDVLGRFYECSLEYPEYENIIRLTGDCPLIDPQVIDEVIKLYKRGRFDYASNVGKITFPDGLDIEIFKRRILARAFKRARLTSEREHVTLYIRNKMKIKKGNLAAKRDFSRFRLTVDNPEDYEVVKFLIKNSRLSDGYLKYIELLKKNPKIMNKNLNLIRNEGLLKSLKNDRQIKK